MSPPRLSLRIVAAALSAVALCAPACVRVSAAGDGDSGVVVQSTGDQSNAISLPPAAAVGQAAASVTTIELSIGASGQQIEVAIEMDTSVSVTELTDDGGYVAVTTVDQIQLTNAPEGVDAAALGYDTLPGAQFEQTFDAHGGVVSAEVLNPETLSDAARQTVEGFIENLQSAQFVYPDVPVGTGAKWSADLDIVTEGFTIPATYSYEITDITGGRYTIALSFDSSFDTTIDGTAATGTVTGTGTVVASVGNPLELSVTVDETIDATAGGVAVNVVIGVDVQATAA
jgi:hypothetical protein